MTNFEKYADRDFITIDKDTPDGFYVLKEV